MSYSGHNGLLAMGQGTVLGVKSVKIEHSGWRGVCARQRATIFVAPETIVHDSGLSAYEHDSRDGNPGHFVTMARGNIHGVDSHLILRLDHHS